MKLHLNILERPLDGKEKPEQVMKQTLKYVFPV